MIVNDMSEINIDGGLINTGFKRTQEKLVEMQNGCICCTLREDLIKEVAELAKQKKFDYLMIESTGIAEPLPVAQAFAFEDDTGFSLSKVARLDTMVTVIDCFNFHSNLSSLETLSETVEKDGKQEEEVSSISQLLIDQIEFANVVILNKKDMVTKKQIKQIEAIVRKLNPIAKILISERGRIQLSSIINTKLYNFEKA